MCNLVNELKARYPKRVIIFDMPPVLNVADTVSFVPCVDCALIVVEDDSTKQVELEHAIDFNARRGCFRRPRIARHLTLGDDHRRGLRGGVARCQRHADHEQQQMSRFWLHRNSLA